MAASGSHPRKNGKAKPASDRPAAHGGGSVRGRDDGAGRAAIEATIPSDFIAGRDVQKRILDDVAAAGYNAEATFAIKLALEEALINAIKHGNKLDPGKKVRVWAKVTPATCEIHVEDEGPGFDRKSVPDPTAEENIEKCSGRGILLMEAYMNSVAWDRGGRRVRMVKKNDPELLPRK
jgi:serine/threonine-protein kinase RsbW